MSSATDVLAHTPTQGLNLIKQCAPFRSRLSAGIVDRLRTSRKPQSIKHGRRIERWSAKCRRGRAKRCGDAYNLRHPMRPWSAVFYRTKMRSLACLSMLQPWMMGYDLPRGSRLGDVEAQGIDMRRSRSRPSWIPAGRCGRPQRIDLSESISHEQNCRPQPGRAGRACLTTA